MSTADREKWDARYRGRSGIAEPADEWLVECATGLVPGRALDLACGLGRNSIWLARQGWTVDAVDVSPVGLQLAREAASRENTGSIHWIAADLDEFLPARAAYDLVTVFRFLERDRLPELVTRGLANGGRLVYETFLTAECDRDGTHIHNRKFTLSPGELPELYSSLRILEYREAELVDRSVARLSAEKE